MFEIKKCITLSKNFESENFCLQIGPCEKSPDFFKNYNFDVGKLVDWSISNAQKKAFRGTYIWILVSIHCVTGQKIPIGSDIAFL